MISIKQLLFSLCFLVFAEANAQQIKGQVKDVDSQLPIPGATVQIKNTKQGTLTDFEGKFNSIQTKRLFYQRVAIK